MITITLIGFTNQFSKIHSKYRKLLSYGMYIAYIGTHRFNKCYFLECKYKKTITHHYYWTRVSIFFLWYFDDNKHIRYKNQFYNLILSVHHLGNKKCATDQQRNFKGRCNCNYVYPIQGYNHFFVIIKAAAKNVSNNFRTSDFKMSIGL